MVPYVGILSRKGNATTPVVIVHRAIGGIREVVQSRYCRKGLLVLAIQTVKPFIRDARGWNIDEGYELALRLKVEVLVLKVAQAGDQESCCAEQRDRQGGLQDHEHTLRSCAGIRRTAVGTAQCLRRIDPGRNPCGGNPEEHAGQQGNTQGKQENGERRRGAERVDLDAPHRQCEHSFHAAISRHKRQGATADGKKDCLDKHLADQARAGCAQCGAYI